MPAFVAVVVLVVDKDAAHDQWLISLILATEAQDMTEEG